MPKLETRRVEVKNFQRPDETRMFEGKGRAEVITLAGQQVGCGTFEPGWRWSNNVKPIAGTELCEFSHLSYCLSGRIRILMSDGTQEEIGPGDVAAIPPGHDAEVVGDEACVLLDFGEFGDYAKRT
ncbi:cupin domain-containing protein [Actinomadura rugatobispora]|uniref:Cupin domain-containing protein n=1 Tax=Actinomadura rugatobispora TaxID=1994 RepID=A0ABW1A3M6_9ACTN|nr:cupin domain-containing protein [Actinomadura rugatobispora]